MVKLRDIDNKKALNLLGNLVYYAGVLFDKIATAELLRELCNSGAGPLRQ